VLFALSWHSNGNKLGMHSSLEKEMMKESLSLSRLSTHMVIISSYLQGEDTAFSSSIDKD